MGDLQDRIAIVTGGSSGIGRGIAVTMACHGADVVVTDLNADSAEAVAGEIRASGRRAQALRHDVTSWDSCRDVVREVLAALGRIDILVNNAGVSRSVPFHQLDEAEWDRVNNVNAKGVFLMCRAVVTPMMEQRSGRIVNISSMVGKEAIPLFAHYCASKFAVIGLTQSLAKELASYNINVNAVCPGVLRTPLWEPLLDQLSATKGISRQAAFDEFVAGIPLGRPQTPEDIGEAVTFLASDRAKEITGVALDVSGGQVTH
jgi:NAD(P)-dependent dehydrogenase (short-subunit alcohol dehydrogenase family)